MARTSTVGICRVCRRPIVPQNDRDRRDIAMGKLKVCIDCIGLDIEPVAVKKPSYRAYLLSSKFQRKRKSALFNAGNCCQVCKSKDNLSVIHNTFDRLGAEWPSDLIVLCRTCKAALINRLPRPPIVMGEKDLERAE